MLFIKQKTAYEMRISDWSSDVCSSDLEHLRANPAFAAAIDPVLREELTDVMERMHAVMAENEQAINAARSANQRIATAIVNAVQAHQSESAGYSAKGRSGKDRSEEHTSELQSLMRISYAVFCLKKKKQKNNQTQLNKNRDHIHHTH